jgi:hypothetical protein
MNQFKEKLYAEFEANAYKLMGVPGNRVREVLAERGEDIDAKFEAAWDFGGATFMRQTMSMTLAILELVYHESEIDQQLTDDEQAERFEGHGIGLDKEAVADWQQTSIAQFEARNHPST